MVSLKKEKKISRNFESSVKAKIVYEQNLIFRLFTPKKACIFFSANFSPVRGHQRIIAIWDKPWIIAVAEGDVLPILPKKVIHESPVGIEPRREPR